MSQRDLGGYFDIVPLLSVQDPNAQEVNTITGRYVSMAGFEWGIIICTALLTDTKTAIFELTQSSAAAATGKADVSGKTKTLTGATSLLDQSGGISFNVNDLTDGDPDKYFVGVDCTTNQAGDLVSAVLMRGGGDYQSDALNG